MNTGRPGLEKGLGHWKMSFVVIAGDDDRIHLAQKFPIVAYAVGNAAGGTQLLRGFRILGPRVGYCPAIQSEFRRMAAPDVFVNARPSGGRQPFRGVSVDDGRCKKTDGRFLRSVR